MWAKDDGGKTYDDRYHNMFHVFLGGDDTKYILRKELTMFSHGRSGFGEVEKSNWSSPTFGDKRRGIRVGRSQPVTTTKSSRHTLLLTTLWKSVVDVGAHSRTRGFLVHTGSFYNSVSVFSEFSTPARVFQGRSYSRSRMVCRPSVELVCLFQNNTDKNRARCAFVSKSEDYTDNSPINEVRVR